MCEALSWSSAQLGDQHEPHAGLLVPVRVQGNERVVRMQLDTAAPTSSLYGRIADQAGLPQTVRYLDIAGQRVDLSPRRIDQPGSFDVNTGLVGTLGGDALEILGLMSLDLVHDLVCIGDEAEAHASDVRTWTAVDLSYNVYLIRPLRLVRLFELVGYPTLEATIAGQTRRVLLDTGSAPVDLLTSRRGLFRRWAGSGVGHADHGVFTASSWGAATQFTRAEVDLNSTLGEVAFSTRGVYFWRHRRMNYTEIDAILGLKPFVGRHVLVLDYRNSRLGLLDAGSP